MTEFRTIVMTPPMASGEIPCERPTSSMYLSITLLHSTALRRSAVGGGFELSVPPAAPPPAAPPPAPADPPPPTPGLGDAPPSAITDGRRPAVALTISLPA